MEQTAAIVVNNAVTMLAVILVANAAMFIIEKMIYFAVDSFAGIKTPEGWLSKIKIKGAGLGKKVS